MAIAVVIIMIVAAVAIPNFLRATNNYKLTSTARNISDLIEQARYQAIKKNTKVSCYFSLGATPPSAWVDINGTGILASNDPKVAYPAQILPTGASLPSTASMGFANATTVANTGTITFDSRGAVDYTGVVGGPTVWVLYFTFNNDSSYGAKAVSLEPLGRTKVWSAALGANSGSWHSP